MRARTSAILLLSLLFLVGACSHADRMPSRAHSNIAQRLRFNVPLGDAPIRGAAGAPVTVVVYADYQCPYCAKLHPLLQQLLRDYDGRVRLVYKDLPLGSHAHAMHAAAAVRAAGLQGRHWEMHDLIYADPEHLAVDDLLGHAARLGLDVVRFRADLYSPEIADAIEADEVEAARFAANGTPTMFVNGRPLRGLPEYRRLVEVVEDELEVVAPLAASLPADALYQAVVGNGLPRAKLRTQEPQPGEPDPAAVRRVPLDGAPALGPDDALVTVVVYADYTCPYAGRTARSLAKARARYGDQLRVVWRALPLAGNPLAMQVAEAATAAGAQGRFWEMQARLFAHQGQLSRADLSAHAAAIGLDVARFDAALDGHSFTAQVLADVASAESLEVKGSPTIFVNGRAFLGAVPYQQLCEGIDLELARARRLLDAGVPADQLYDALTAAPLQ